MAIHIRKDDGRVLVVYRDRETGKVKHEGFGRGPEALMRAEARNRELGFYKRPQRSAAGGPIFDDLAAAYMRARHFSANSLKHLIIRLGTLSPEIGHRPAASISPDDLDRYIDRRRRDPVHDRGGNLLRTGVKWSTIARELTDVKAILNFAAKRGLITHNPLRDYKKPKPDYDIIDPPTVAEVRRILAAASPHLYRAIKLSFYTGLRPGAVELLSLSWDRVNFESGIIRIISAKKGGPCLRDVPVHPNLAEELKSWHKEDGGAGLIIHYHKEGIKKIGHAWRLTLQRAGITRRLRPYDLRHYFVTRALSEGADIKALSEVVGSSPATIMHYYQHVSRKQHIETVGKMPDLK